VWGFTLEQSLARKGPAIPLRNKAVSERERRISSSVVIAGIQKRSFSQTHSLLIAIYTLFLELKQKIGHISKF
jgi:hypothetical protein